MKIAKEQERQCVEFVGTVSLLLLSVPMIHGFEYFLSVSCNKHAGVKGEQTAKSWRCFHMGPGLAGVKHAGHLGHGCVSRVSVLEGIESRLGSEYRMVLFSM